VTTPFSSSSGGGPTCRRRQEEEKKGGSPKGETKGFSRPAAREAGAVGGDVHLVALEELEKETLLLASSLGKKKGARAIPLFRKTAWRKKKRRGACSSTEEA